MTRANKDGDLDLAAGTKDKDSAKAWDGNRQLHPENLLAFAVPKLTDALKRQFPGDDVFFVKDDAKPDPEKKAWMDIVEKQLKVALPKKEHDGLRDALLNYFGKQYDAAPMLAGALKEAAAQLDKEYGSNEGAKELAKAQRVTGLLFDLAKNDADAVRTPDKRFSKNFLRETLIDPFPASQKADLAALKEFPNLAADAKEDVIKKVGRAQVLVRQETTLKAQGKELGAADKKELADLRKQKDSLYPKPEVKPDAKPEDFGVKPHIPEARGGKATQRMQDLRAKGITTGAEYDACDKLRGASRGAAATPAQELPWQTARAVYIKARNDGLVKPGSPEESALVKNLWDYATAKEKGKSDDDIKDVIAAIKKATTK